MGVLLPGCVCCSFYLHFSSLPVASTRIKELSSWILILFAVLRSSFLPSYTLAQLHAYLLHRNAYKGIHGDCEADPVSMVTETGTVAEYPRTFWSEGRVERWARAGNDNVNLPHRINFVCSSDGYGTLDSRRLNVFCGCTGQSSERARVFAPLLNPWDEENGHFCKNKSGFMLPNECCLLF